MATKKKVAAKTRKVAQPPAPPAGPTYSRKMITKVAYTPTGGAKPPKSKNTTAAPAKPKAKVFVAATPTTAPKPRPPAGQSANAAGAPKERKFDWKLPTDSANKPYPPSTGNARGGSMVRVRKITRVAK